MTFCYLINYIMEFVMVDICLLLTLLIQSNHTIIINHCHIKTISIDISYVFVSSESAGLKSRLFVGSKVVGRLNPTFKRFEHPTQKHCRQGSHGTQTIMEGAFGFRSIMFPSHFSPCLDKLPRHGALKGLLPFIIP